MGARGPLPTPLPENVRLLRAEATHSAPEEPLKARPRRPSCPRHLDAYARRTWRAVVRELEPLGVLSSLDREELAAYCEAASLARRAWLELVGEDLVQRDRGHIRKHPAVEIWARSSALLDRLGRQLGLTPAARLRMPRPEAEEDDADLD